MEAETGGAAGMRLRYTGEAPEREVFAVIGDTFRQLFREDPKVVYLDADLMGAIKTQDLWHEFPKRVFNTGIQEANMIGVACGLYLNGFKPYVHSFTAFASRRVFDQVFVSGAYGKKSLRIIGSDAGIMATHNGGTHMCFEDVAMMRTIPGACIVDVSDPAMCGAFLRLTKERPGVTYIRTARRGLPDIYAREEAFAEGKAKILREGSDVTLIGCGIMVATCLEAAELLADKGISARVVDIVTIKPLDEETVLEAAKATRAIVTAENANILGGLGSAVCEYLSKTYPVRVAMVGVQDDFGCVGSEIFLREKYGMTAEAVASRAESLLKE